MMTFAYMHQNLLKVVRQRVINGEITESHLARMVGVSQPHIHNVLKGVRMLSSELADSLLEQLRIGAEELLKQTGPVYALPFRPVPMLVGNVGMEMMEWEPRKTSGFAHLPSEIVARAGKPLAARVGIDGLIRPRFEEGDLILIDQATTVQRILETDSICIVKTVSGPRLRYVRQSSGRAYLANEYSRGNPGEWEPWACSNSEILPCIGGSVVWMSRLMESHFPFQDACAAQR